jgi:hypothetical protein
MNYLKVQFVSWELNTGPDNIHGYVGLNFNPIVNDKRLDFVSQCLDIEARVLFTQDAINKAHSYASSDTNTLKVFMAPEFLYRGMGGAYVHDLINGWESTPPRLIGAPFNQKWGGLFGKLQDFVANDKFNNWVFVFGTAVSASFQTMDVTIPNRKEPIQFIDLSKPAEGYNTSLIQVGGSANHDINYTSRKHYKSGIDFINHMEHYTSHIDSNIGHSLDSWDKNLNDLLGSPEGGASFTLKNINTSDGKPLPFGIEICLDHQNSTSSGGNVQNFGRLKSSNQHVKIQLVPSGGMSLVDASIMLTPSAGPTPNSYAFNCDGLSNLTSPWAGCHTQIWNGANGALVQLANKLFEANGGFALANTQIVPVIKKIVSTIPQVNNTNDVQLWKNGAGAVRVINPLDL